jgi:hypothetical protein
VGHQQADESAHATGEERCLLAPFEGRQLILDGSFVGVDVAKIGSVIEKPGVCRASPA